MAFLKKLNFDWIARIFLLVNTFIIVGLMYQHIQTNRYETLAFKDLNRGFQNSALSINNAVETTMASFEAKTKKENQGHDFFKAAENIRVASNEFQIGLNELENLLRLEFPEKTETHPWLKFAQTHLLPRKSVSPEWIAEIEATKSALLQKINRPIEVHFDSSQMNTIQNSIYWLSSVGTQTATAALTDLPPEAAFAHLEELKCRVMNTEYAIISHLFGMVGENTIIYDQFRPAVIPSATYVQQGEKFEAQIYLAATSSMSKPIVKIDGKTIEVGQDGIATYQTTPKRTGKHQLMGSLTFKDGYGQDKTLPFSYEYTVDAPCY